MDLQQSTVTGTIDDLARRIAAYVSVERRMFEILGGWARQPAGPNLQRRLAELALGHAERVEWWEARLPDAVADPPTSERLSAPVEESVAELAELAGSESDTESFDDRRLAAAEAVQLRLAAIYRAHRRAVDDRVDAPTARVLDRVIAMVEG